ncbi:MAG: PAS domain-containing protein [Clostridia bacterium]|nr:PAS domain-containing protein [Clostridia bacterium]
MNFQLEDTAEILNRSVSGFRKYRLQEPILPLFVSANAAQMLGYEQEALSDAESDRYAECIHPADRASYDAFLKRAAEQKKPCSAEYRLIKRDGSVIWVKDTLNVEQTANGAPVGYAVLTDVTAMRVENDNLRFLNETVPCGMLRYTCDKNPKVLYVNDQMLKMLRIPAGGETDTDCLEFYKENIYLMIPIEERRKFAHFLNRVSVSGTPVAGEISILRCDGTRARLFGWVTKVTDKDGNEAFQSVCMDVTERYHTKRADETDRYLRALADVYENIFEYDFANGTVKYVSGSSGTFGKIKNMPMHMEEATSQWIEGAVCEQNRTEMREFFNSFFLRRKLNPDDCPPQIRYRALSSNGEMRQYTGIFLKVSDSVSLFCCQHIVDEQEISALRKENLELRNMQALVTQFTEGIMAFKVENNYVKPLYASDNVCHFFGFTREEWLAMAENNCSIKELIAQSSLSYEDVEVLFSTGEAEFTYFDITQQRKRLIKAVCSQKNADGISPCYVMLYNVEKWQDAAPDSAAEQVRIDVRTFGYFDVFVNDKPIAFRNKKAKELLALLVDRRGGYVTSEEAIGYLWEDEPVSAVTLARYRKEALRLKNTLEEYGIADIVESVDGKRRLIPEKVRCDLYDYLSRKEEYAGLFKGSYLTNYSWGEMTLGELTGSL